MRFNVELRTLEGGGGGGVIVEFPLPFMGGSRQLVDNYP